MVVEAATAGGVAVVTAHTDGAGAGRSAGVVVGALLAFGSRAVAKASLRLGTRLILPAAVRGPHAGQNNATST
jgi:hydrogenase maturation factor